MQTERVSYPYVEDERGIPFDQIIDSYRSRGEHFGDVKGGSGADLIYSIGKDFLIVEDSEFPDRHLWASVIEGTAIFYAQTRSSALDEYINSPEGVHPDMFASRFIAFSFQYFRENNIEIEACKGVWLPGSSNQDVFMREFEINGDAVKAAKETWSGKLFTSFGFTEIREEDINFIVSEEAAEGVVVLFRKQS